MAVKNKLILDYILVLFFALFYGCISPSRHESLKEVNFSCSKVYVDTTGIDASILFKVLVSNKSKLNFYFFSNPSFLHKDSVNSNFFLLDPNKNQKFQLLSSPPVNPLYSGKSYEIPLSMIRQITWKELKKKGTDNTRTYKKKSKRALTIELLKGSQIVLFSDKRDFRDYDIDLQYFIKDTIKVMFTDSV